MLKETFKIELQSPRIRAWLERRVGHIVAVVRARPWQDDLQRVGAQLQRIGVLSNAQRLGERMEQVQRFGGQAWRTIAARWPALAELVRERTIVSARYRPPPADNPSPPLSDEAIGALLAQLSSSPSWQARRSAALSLGHVEADGVVPALIRALRDTSVEVAVAVVDGLASHDEPASTQALISVLQNPDGYYSPVTRVAAISGLARRLPPDELAPLYAAIRDIDAEVSIAAIAVVAERVPGLARDHLLPILRDRSGYFLPLVRLAAANALDRSGGLQESLAAELLQSEGDPSVRRVLERARYVISPESAALT